MKWTETFAMETRHLKKRQLIKQHVAGLSYVDIGGLWGTSGETVTTALQAGASRAVMADIQTPGGPWWQKFEEHCAAQGVDGYEEMQVDICAPDAPDTLGKFDFVHCAGVMYHVADLFRFVGNLVSVTERYLLLSSVVMPSEVTGSAGTLHFGPDNAYLSPILSETNRAIVAEYWTERGLHADGIHDDTPYLKGVQTRFSPWWWLFSGEFMSRTLEMYGLEVLDQGPSPRGNAFNVFARVKDV